MIGFMAGAGIVVRKLNHSWWISSSLRLAERHAARSSGGGCRAVRFRPMLLTALAVVVGASVILARPDLPGPAHLADGGRDRLPGSSAAWPSQCSTSWPIIAFPQ